MVVAKAIYLLVWQAISVEWVIAMWSMGRNLVAS
jgi:hypothetical protein